MVESGTAVVLGIRASSASGKTACVSCHLPYARLWGVTRSRTAGIDSGQPRKSRKIAAACSVSATSMRPIGWDRAKLPSLEAQAKGLFCDRGAWPCRANINALKVEVVEQRFRAIPDYAAMFRTALPRRPDQCGYDGQGDRGLLSEASEPGIAPFDRWIEGDESANYRESAKRGFALFNTKANCSGCHSGWRFTDDNFHDIGTSTTDRGRGNQMKDFAADAICVQDADLALGGAASALLAQRVRRPTLLRRR